MAQARVGVDMVDVRRMEQALARTPRLKDRLFTPAEQRYCEKRSRPAEHYAARFAAREAVLKMLGSGFSGMGLKDVQVVVEKSGQPRAQLSGNAQKLAARLGIEEIALSLSHTHEVAVANAVALTRDIRPQVAETADPDQELRASFREAKALLAELDAAQEQLMEPAAEAGEPAPAAPEPPASPDAPAPR